MLKVQNREIDTLRDVIDAYHDFADTSDSTRSILRSGHRLLSKLANGSQGYDAVSMFKDSPDPETKRMRTQFLMGLYSDMKRLFEEEKPGSVDKLAYMLRSVQRCLKWMNSRHGSSLIVLDDIRFLNIKRVVPPVLTMPIDEVDKVLRFSNEDIKKVAAKDFTPQQVAAIADALFLSKLILYTSFRPSDAVSLTGLNVMVANNDTKYLQVAAQKTGKKSMAVVPESFMKEFIERCNNSTDRPVTMETEAWERADERETVGGVKKDMRGQIRPYVEQKDWRIFRYNQNERIQNDDYYVRTYGMKLFRHLNIKSKSGQEHTSYLNIAIQLCGVKFTLHTTRQVGRKHIKQVFTEKDVSSYWLRRTAITRLLAADLSPDVVRIISGHSPSSQSFQRYVDKSQVLTSASVIEKLTSLNTN